MLQKQRIITALIACGVVVGLAMAIQLLSPGGDGAAVIVTPFLPSGDGVSPVKLRIEAVEEIGSVTVECRFADVETWYLISEENYVALVSSERAVTLNSGQHLDITCPLPEIFRGPSVGLPPDPLVVATVVVDVEYAATDASDRQFARWTYRIDRGSDDQRNWILQSREAGLARAKPPLRKE